MSLTPAAGQSTQKPAMYIRGIPFYANNDGSGNAQNARDASSPGQDRQRAASAWCVGDRGKIIGQEQAAFIKARQAVRRFVPKGVSMALLRQLVGTAAATDLHGRARFVVVESPAAMDRLAGLLAAWMRREGAILDGPNPAGDVRQLVLQGAPHLAVVHGPAGDALAAAACREAMARMEWAAASAGLGSCCVGALIQAAAVDAALAAALSMPQGHLVHAALALGQPLLEQEAAQAKTVRMIWL